MCPWDLHQVWPAAPGHCYTLCCVPSQLRGAVRPRNAPPPSWSVELCMNVCPSSCSVPLQTSVPQPALGPQDTPKGPTPALDLCTQHGYITTHVGHF